MKIRRTWRNALKSPDKPRRLAVVRETLARRVAGLLRGRRKPWVLGGAGVALAALGAVWLFAGDGESGPPDPRARQYADFDACLLTGRAGVGGPDAVPVWAGMQDASAETRARVNYVPVMGEQSVKNAGPYLNSLLQRQCDVVLAVGKAQVGVVEAEAGRHPKVRFVVVDGDATAANVTAAASGDRLPERVADAVREAFKEAGSPRI
ncbi:BMP family ABC transporter substrate-binding protein [Streptomyces sp. A3M-1-3]|uniref:BMP family ABC transporter substrate-binding protein n=1 Tax=Streptomyces sp. A3M-1-3 TaxID=2962044 RepID=UPI0020B72BAE|nr:BMP family ABC transporter substrate-binding protein [Streptomyces sp. A3M-1-3]MCP3820579.1 BMP family ABC transporter substrate-binding protein [Streptomyces sp. A3M-1-3]